MKICINSKKMAAEVNQIPTATLKLYIEDEELKQKYIKYAEKHNNKIFSTTHPDSGFDLLLPDDVRIRAKTSQFINFKVKCEMTFNDSPMGFYLYPRSSTYKKYGIILTNSVGVIDSGYRGNIGGHFYSTENENIEIATEASTEFITKDSRIVQICTPTLTPIIVKIVNSLLDLTDTIRGDKGFGSTGN